MARGVKTCCNMQWTDARRTSFITSALRGATNRWAPKQEIVRLARLRRGWYRCAECKEEIPATLPPKPGNKRRIKNVIVDHIIPVIDPHVGRTTWDSFIERLFCEMDNLQVICHACHQIKCNEEKEIANERRRNEKV